MRNSQLFHAKSKDKNHNAVKDALVEIGCQCYDTHKQGNGFPDILVVTPKYNLVVLLEIKHGYKPLTKAEYLFNKEYKGILATVFAPSHAVILIKTIEGEFADYYQETGLKQAFNYFGKDRLCPSE